VNVDPTPFQTTMIEERKDPSGVVKPIVSDSFLSFLNDLRDAGNAAFAQVGSGTVGPAFRNALADGGFEVWDGARLLTLPAATGYTGCTMWSYQSSAGFAGYTVSRQPGLVPGSQYALRYQRTVLGADVAQQSLIYDMETVNSLAFAGQKICLSFTARCGATYSAALSRLTALIVTGTGTDQPWRTVPYTGFVLTGKQCVLTTSAQRFQVFVDIPATCTQIGVIFAWTPVGVAGISDQFDIDDVQVEASTYATVFERLPWEVTRQRVFRHYWKSFAYDTAPANAVGVANAVTFWQAVAAGVATACTITLPVPMRIIPTLVTFNPAAANVQIRNTTIAADWTGTATVSATGNIALAGFTNAGSAVGNINAVHVTADARI
jgi:hypothetical protein